MELINEFNKKIRVLRLAVTTECILDCRYCFVDKKRRVIAFTTAAASIDLLLYSPGKKKLLIIYGGEPILFFDLVKNIILYAKTRAIEARKDLIISIGTNGILLKPEHLSFFAKTNVKLSVSLDGQKKYHDKMRIFPDGSGSFRQILPKIHSITNLIKQENLCVLFGILPSSINQMHANLIYLTQLGFYSINIEPIHDRTIVWRQKHKGIFLQHLKKFLFDIFEGIFDNRFIFLNSINREIEDKRLSSRKNICPFFENLEIYPDGEMAFSPYLINSKHKERFLIGNIRRNIEERYRRCSFNQNKKTCLACWSAYAKKKSPTSPGGENLYGIRDRCSVYFAEKIRHCAHKSPLFKKYIREAKKRIFE